MNHNFAARVLASTSISAASAEQAIREAVNEASYSIGKPFYIKTKFNGVMVPFEAVVNKLPSGSEQARGLKSRVILQTVKRGRLIAGDELSWLMHTFELNGKDQFKPIGYPKKISDKDAESFLKHFGIKP